MKISGNKGYTLTEILAATVIALPLLVVIMQIVPGMLKARAQSEVTTLTATLAVQKMEEVRRLIASTNPSYGYSHNYNQTATAFSSPFQNYSYSVTDSLGTWQKALRVTVWKNPSYTTSVDALVARRN
jgi:type II secretory pathway pseudopilin PulG